MKINPPFLSLINTIVQKEAYKTRGEANFFNNLIDYFVNSGPSRFFKFFKGGAVI